MDTNSKNHRIADLAVLCILALLVIWYVIDAYRASTNIINLILVLPIGMGVLGLCAFQLVIQLRKPPAKAEQLEPVVTVLPVMGLFSAYVFSLSWIGFDVGTMLFVSVFLWLHGERRLLWVSGYGIVFGFAVAWFFSTMLPYPMPMLILPTEY